MPRIANHKIESKISNLEDFENYNATITATSDETHYVIVHWNTVILTYNTKTNTIEFLSDGFISQTTSTLVGRIVRSLPRNSVLDHIHNTDSKQEQRRLASMLRL